MTVASMPAGNVCFRRMSQGQGGFTYVWLLAAIALLCAGLAAIGPSWSEQARRERERELLRVGAIYAGAIADYYKASPGSVKEFPRSLRELLADTRMVGTVRYLRKLYPDPLDASRSWGLVLDSSGNVRGVYSQSSGIPLRVEPLELETTTLSSARRYSDWKFIAKTSP